MEMKLAIRCRRNTRVHRLHFGAKPGFVEVDGTDYSHGASKKVYG